LKHPLQNANTQILVDELGAELQSLMVDGKERLWTADPKWWNRHSPVLFPFVGKSRDNQFMVDGKSYPMSQHGFARDSQFQFDESKSSENSLHFTLFDTGESLQNFPFPFELHLTYTLLKKGVHLRYEVFNPGNRPLPFALGAHPGFLTPAESFDDLNIQFSEAESFERHLLQDGLFNGEIRDLGTGSNLDIYSERFDLDAIVFKNIHSKQIRLQGGGMDLEIQFGGFEDLGIWTKKGCRDFLCLEPWHGYADSTEGATELEERAGIHILEPGKSFEAFWQVVVV